MKILFFIPYNQPAPYIESTMITLASGGDEVILLTIEEEGQLHLNLDNYNIRTHSLDLKRKNTLQFLASRIFKLALFCRKNNIDVVHSHYQEGNIISVFVQYLCNAHFILTRHHSDCAFIDDNRKERIADRIINRLAMIQLVPSTKVYRQVVEIEKGNKKKVLQVNYGYDFSKIPEPDVRNIDRIREEFNCQTLIVSAARLITEKRHELVIRSVSSLKEDGFDIKLLILGKGPMEDHLKELVLSLNLEKEVHLLGFKENVHDYFGAADLIAHFSISEASNSAIKEAALQLTPTVVCKGVGDFDEYFRHLDNGFLLDKEQPDKSFVTLFPDIVSGQYDLKNMSLNLKFEILKRFDIKNIISFYNSLHHDLYA